jgi:hypothetical protein
MRFLAVALLAAAPGCLGAPFGTQKALVLGCDGSGIVDPSHPCPGDGIVAPPSNPTPGSREGFEFDNQSTNCKYMSQPAIWDAFKSWQTDLTQVLKLVNKNVDLTVMGHQPIAGHYDNVLIFFVNAIRRLGSFMSENQDKFEVHPLGIHGACDSKWSVQEVQFKGLMNNG